MQFSLTTFFNCITPTIKETGMRSFVQTLENKSWIQLAVERVLLAHTLEIEASNRHLNDVLFCRRISKKADEKILLND